MQIRSIIPDFTRNSQVRDQVTISTPVGLQNSAQILKNQGAEFLKVVEAVPANDGSYSINVKDYDFDTDQHNSNLVAIAGFKAVNPANDNDKSYVQASIISLLDNKKSISNRDGIQADQSEITLFPSLGKKKPALVAQLREDGSFDLVTKKTSHDKGSFLDIVKIPTYRVGERIIHTADLTGERSIKIPTFEAVKLHAQKAA